MWINFRPPPTVFGVVLTSQPTADVLIGLSSSNEAEGVVSPGSVRFSATDWNVPQIVTVAGVDDSVVDGSIGCTVVTAPLSSADALYDGLDAPDVNITHRDDDTAGVRSSPSRIGVIEGFSASYALQLTAEPRSPVTMTPAGVGLGFVPGSLVFTPTPFDQVGEGRRIRDNSERDQTKLDELAAATAAWRNKLEAQADALNKQHNRRAVFIVPVGDAVVKLRALIAAGKFPGVAKQAELFRDPIGHGMGHIQALAAYCNFAAIYRRTPAGLTLNEPGVDAMQHAILQRIAWETVSSYPHSGVEKPE